MAIDYQALITSIGEVRQLMRAEEFSLRSQPVTVGMDDKEIERARQSIAGLKEHDECLAKACDVLHRWQWRIRAPNDWEELAKKLKEEIGRQDLKLVRQP